MANIAEFAAAYVGRGLSEMSTIDADLKKAFHEDAKAYLGDVIS